MKPYYYVLNRRHGIPTVKHETVEIAQSEAERMAQKNPGNSFEILRCVGITSTPKASTFWMHGEGPPDKPRYRMLEHGEKLEDGDEYQMDGEWRGVRAFGVKLHGIFSKYPHRRPL